MIKLKRIGQGGKYKIIINDEESKMYSVISIKKKGKTKYGISNGDTKTFGFIGKEEVINFIKLLIEMPCTNCGKKHQLTDWTDPATNKIYKVCSVCGNM